MGSVTPAPARTGSATTRWTGPSRRRSRSATTGWWPTIPGSPTGSEPSPWRAAEPGSGVVDGAEADGDVHGVELGQDLGGELGGDVGDGVADLVAGAEHLAFHVDVVVGQDPVDRGQDAGDVLVDVHQPVGADGGGQRDAR